jgi:hypothetical protein
MTDLPSIHDAARRILAAERRRCKAFWDAALAWEAKLDRLRYMKDGPGESVNEDDNDQAND